MTEPPPPVKSMFHRRLPDGSYNNKPSDPNYFKNYFHTAGSELTTCYRCGTTCRKNYLCAHTKTKKCWKEMAKRSEELKSFMPELDF